MEGLVRVRRGDVYCKANRWDKAAKDYDLAISVALRDEHSKDVVAAAYEHKGKFLRQIGETDEAMRCDEYASTYRNEAKQQFFRRNADFEHC